MWFEYLSVYKFHRFTHYTKQTRLTTNQFNIQIYDKVNQNHKLIKLYFQFLFRYNLCLCLCNKYTCNKFDMI